MGGERETCRKCREIHEQFVRDGLFKPAPFQQCSVDRGAPSDCPATELLAENLPAWEVYTRVWNQVVSIGMDGLIIGIHLPSVYLVMHSLGVKGDDELSVLDKVITCHDMMHPIKKDTGEHPDVDVEEPNGSKPDTTPWRKRR